MEKLLKIAVFGAGKMGTVIAWDLCRSPEVERVALVDTQPESLRRASDRIGRLPQGGKLKKVGLDVLGDPAGVRRLLEECDAAAIAMPNRKISYSLIEAAIETRRPCVDILEEYHRHPDHEEAEGSQVDRDKGEALHERAAKLGVMILDGMGFEPGLTNVTAGAGIRRTDPGAPGLEARVRVGGVPAEKFQGCNDLQYMITWSFEHALREYVIQTRVIRDSMKVEVNSADDFESVRVPRSPGQGFYELQAAITPGMPSYLHTWAATPWQLRHFDAKTLRWPAHWPLIRTFKSLGLLEEKVRPAVAAALTQALAPSDGMYDLAVMQNTIDGMIQGRKTRQTFRLVVEGNPIGSDDDRLSGMARVTAFPAAWGALQLASGRLESPGGIRAPEEVIYDRPEGPAFYSDLKQYLDSDDRGVRIIEELELIA